MLRRSVVAHARVTDARVGGSKRTPRSPKRGRLGRKCRTRHDLVGIAWRRMASDGDHTKVQLLTPEFIVFCLYLVAGPGAWTLYGLAVHSGHRKMLRLRRPPIR